jgi:uncharacterized phosphosugar-binding protein
MSKGVEYLHAAAALLERAAENEGKRIEAVAGIMARSISSGGLVHLFGSGHSMLPALELFPRYGSFVGLHPLVDPRLLWVNVLGSGGVPEMLFLQTVEGYATIFLDGQHLLGGDVLVIFSHSGTSAISVEAAIYAKERGLTVVGIISSETAAAKSRHSSGNKLVDLADHVIDTGIPRGEGLVKVDGLAEPVGAGSTIAATAIGLALVAACAEQLVQLGHEVVQSVRSESNEHLAYRTVYEAYEASLRRPK